MEVWAYRRCILPISNTHMLHICDYNRLANSNVHIIIHWLQCRYKRYRISSRLYISNVIQFAKKIWRKMQQYDATTAMTHVVHLSFHIIFLHISKKDYFNPDCSHVQIFTFVLQYSTFAFTYYILNGSSCALSILPRDPVRFLLQVSNGLTLPFI